MQEEEIKSKYIHSDIIFSWLFKHLNPPQLLKIPKSLQIKPSLSQLQKNWTQELHSPNPSFFKAMFKTIWKEILFSSLIHAFSYSQKAVSAAIVKLIIDYLQETNQNSTKENLLISGVVMTTFILTVGKSNAEYRMILLIGKIKAMINLMIVKKVMVINSNSIEEGKVLNVLSADLELIELLMYSPFLLGAPINIIIFSLLVYYIISAEALIGLAASICHIPVIILLTLAGKKARAKIALVSDGRIKLLTNLVEGIKIFKFYTWELAYAQRICDKRREEIGKRYFLANYNVLMSVGSIGGIYLCIFMIFYVCLGF